MPPLQRIVYGNPWPTRVADYNHFVDTVDHANAERQRGEPPASEALPWGTAVRVKNGTTKTIERGEVIAVSGALNDPQSAELAYRQRPDTTGEKPDFNSHFGQAGIAHEAFAVGEFGYCYVSGIAIARLHEKNGESNCQFADVVNLSEPSAGGIDYYLQTHWSGSWQILNRSVTADGGGQGSRGWAMVLHTGLQQRMLKCRLSGSVAPNTTTTADVFINQQNQNPAQITVHWNWLRGGNPFLASNKEAFAMWFNDELKWVLIDVDCI